ncbi:MAG: sigma-70 family RNA polymerase sigma factor [Prevotella sp.]|uniref:RNA polymerase sigma factor n=1 Tax=Prevotella sp. TaxID=59823 RepID=UPI002A34E5E0|nr:sigma-70 family RNA polymerase sigma factor [Prevotella sp.]MDD7318485.1 sigma-70 family RNA polymerase sigma factor [Prevotellaceae bacterium]MDY4020164.1 sigma-70 family RNA polymerase sigma factor [Prevotella sp.]
MEIKAYEKLAMGLRKRALQVGMSLGMGRAEAEDIAQEVMLRLWQMRNELDERGKTENLAAIMARNMSIDRKRRERTVTLDDRQRDLSSPAKTPAERIEADEEEQWLMRKLEQLPTTQHAILRMRHDEQLSHEDIAKRLGITVSSVSTLLSRARHSLLEEIRRRNRR